MIARHRPVPLLLGALILAACNDETPPPQPGSFDRPNRVAFACLDGERVVALGRCRGSEEDRDDGLSMHALVTQSTRGEIAAVDLEVDGILDAREDIPGFTFARVGELPVAAVVPPDHAHTTYVANFGSRDITLLDTARLLAGRGTDDATLATVPVEHMGARGAPVDMVMSPDQDALLVAVPELGQVLRFPIERCGDDGTCREGRIATADDGRPATTAVDLSESAAHLVTSMPDDGETPEPYALLCGFERPSPPRVEPPTVSNAQLMVQPQPRVLEIDDFCPSDGAEGCSPRLLVADEALPVIHAIDLDALAAGDDALLEPIAVGSPTLDVAVTPRVPASLDGDGETQFVYAIDARDGSVIVTENGRVLSVNTDPNFRPDRILLDSRASRGPTSAAALEILTPGFDVRGPAAQYARRTQSDGVPEGEDPELYCTDDDHDEQDPSRLRGVFLAVALTDGSVRVVDVHDNELQACRDCANRPHVTIESIDEDGVITIEPTATWQPMVGDVVRAGDQETVVELALSPISFRPAARIAADTGELEVEAPPALPVLIRHHARLRQSFIDDDPSVRATLNPAESMLEFVVDGLAFAVRNNGTAGSPDAPGLDCFTCDDDLVQVFPDPEDLLDLLDDEAEDDTDRDAGALPDGGTLPDGGVQSEAVCPTRDRTALLCASADPWTPVDDLWSFTYEGVLPGVRGGRGRFRDADDPASHTGMRVEFVSEGGFCAAGVLGDTDIGFETEDLDCLRDPEPRGDQLVINTLPPARDLLRATLEEKGVDFRDDDLEACDELREALLDQEEDHILAFPIEKAFDDFLALFDRGNMVEEVAGIRTWRDVERCLGGPGEPLEYVVRTRGSFSVQGNASGFVHRVVAHESGRCTVDREQDARLRGRAWLGCTFRNRTLQVRPWLAADPDDVTPVPRNVRLRTQVFTPATKVQLDGNLAGFTTTTTVPIQLFFNAVDERLYLMDIHRRGLVPISLDPFPEFAPGSFN